MKSESQNMHHKLYRIHERGNDLLTALSLLPNPFERLNEGLEKYHVSWSRWDFF